MREILFRISDLKFIPGPVRVIIDIPPWEYLGRKKPSNLEERIYRNRKQRQERKRRKEKALRESDMGTIEDKQADVFAHRSQGDQTDLGYRSVRYSYRILQS